MTELCEFALANLQLKLNLKPNPGETEKIKRSLLIKILEEEKKNKNRKLAIAKLLYLLRFLSVDEQIMKTYHVLATKLAQCDTTDLDFLDFIITKGSGEFLNRSRMDIVLAMSIVAKYKISSVPEGALESVYERFKFLKSLGLSFYFEPPVFSLHNKRVKAEQAKKTA